MPPKITVVIYDAGFKETSPALETLANQTILEDLQIFWVDYSNKIFSKVFNYDFITPVVLNLPIIPKYKWDIAYCYNVGLWLANGEFICLMDPCLWGPPDAFERILEELQNNPYDFIYSIEHFSRYGGSNNAKILTDKYNSNINNIKKREMQKKVKIKLDNTGCMWTVRTEYAHEVGGFDILDDPPGNSDTLCLNRMRNRFNIKSIAVNLPMYHPCHPRAVYGKSAPHTRRSLVKRVKESLEFTTSSGLFNMKERYFLEKSTKPYKLSRKYD